MSKKAQGKQTPQNWQSEAAYVLLLFISCWAVLPIYQLSPTILSLSLSPLTFSWDDKLCSIYMCCAVCL